MSSYTLVGNTWPAGTTTITYSFATGAVNGNPLTAEITDPFQRTVITDAFAAWTQLAGISFVREPDGSVSNIRIGYSDDITTAGVLGLTTLSFATNGLTDPTSPYIRLEDPSEIPLVLDPDGQLYYRLSGNYDQDATLEQLAIHEIGHVLGFADNQDPNSIENEVLDSNNRTFDATDLAGVQALYPRTAEAALPDAAVSKVALPPTTLFSLVNTNESNATTSIRTDSYDGPLSFLSHGDAFSYNGSDNVQISVVDATNPLMASGSGDDLLTGSHLGTSVLDGGTGANIETDGGNGKTTFVQNGYVTGATWDFIQNFHGADEDVVFGYISGLSKISVQAIGGLASDTGATVTIIPGNGNSEEVTLVGLSAAEIHGCSATIEGVPSWVIFV